MATFLKHDFGFFERTKHIIPFKMYTAHFHDVHELYFLETGKTTYFIGSELYLLEAGDMIFVPKGTFHKTDSDESPAVERLLFMFDDDFAGADFSSYINELKTRKHVRFPKESIYKIKEVFQKIEKEIKKQEKGFEEMQRLYLREMLILISRYRVTQNVTQFKEYYAIIQDAAKYISENCNEELSLEHLSKKYAMSASHFSRQFKAVTGVCLNEYINISRITAAEKLLLNTNMPITKIATQCGFNDSNYFAAVFKKIKGITPKKYSMLYK